MDYMKIARREWKYDTSILTREEKLLLLCSNSSFVRRVEDWDENLFVSYVLVKGRTAIRRFKEVCEGGRIPDGYLRELFSVACDAGLDIVAYLEEIGDVPESLAREFLPRNAIFLKYLKFPTRYEVKMAVEMDYRAIIHDASPDSRIVNFALEKREEVRGVMPTEIFEKYDECFSSWYNSYSGVKKMNLF